MLIDKERGQSKRQRGLDVDKDFEVIRRDQDAQDDNELSDDSEESVSLALIRIIPLFHGGFVGESLGNLMLGLSAGMALSIALDLCMGNASLVRFLIHRLVTCACPIVAVTAHRLANSIKRLGLPAPSTLHRLKCGDAQSG
jgi:hypothetical protein